MHFPENRFFKNWIFDQNRPELAKIDRNWKKYPLKTGKKNTRSQLLRRRAIGPLYAGVLIDRDVLVPTQNLEGAASGRFCD
jgi:hypothetical protein